MITYKSNCSKLQTIFWSLDQQSCVFYLHYGVLQIDAFVIYGGLKGQIREKAKRGSFLCWNSYSIWWKNDLDLDFSSRIEYWASTKTCCASTYLRHPIIGLKGTSSKEALFVKLSTVKALEKDWNRTSKSSDFRVAFCPWQHVGLWKRPLLISPFQM